MSPESQTYHDALLGTCCNVQAAGKQTLPVIVQVSEFESVCKSPVVTPYLFESALQFEAGPRSCPAQVVVAGAEVVVALPPPRLIEVTGGAPT